jgi:predicted ATP-dependent protease
MGKEGVVQIDREVELAGPIHNKGVMTLVGYLGGHYAQDQPLSLSAQITFEQNYGGIEGDSASSTELFALLSSLSGMPIKQTVAVTGSVNQRGEIQAIGGVSEKAEGWFEVCKQRGLNGDQGVIIPAANVKDLMINAEVRQAVVEGKFHLWAIATVDEGLEILTGKAPRKVHEAAVGRLRSLAEGLEAFGKKE